MSARATTIVIGLLAVILLAGGVFVIVSVSGLESEVDDLEATVGALQRQTALQESKGGESASSLKEVASRLRKIEECLPEIQTELNSLELEAIGDEYYVGTGSQVSSYCSPVVYPSPDE